MRVVGALLAASLLLLAGCGGPIRADELQRGVQSIGALAAEGELLADGTARDRTKTTFTRVQARTLGEQATHEAEKLADATAPPRLERARSSGVRLAQDVADALGELQVRPDDPAVGAAARGRLGRLSDEATSLAGRL